MDPPAGGMLHMTAGPFKGGAITPQDPHRQPAPCSCGTCWLRPGNRRAQARATTNDTSLCCHFEAHSLVVRHLTKHAQKRLHAPPPAALACLCVHTHARAVVRLDTRCRGKRLPVRDCMQSNDDVRTACADPLANHATRHLAHPSPLRQAVQAVHHLISSAWHQAKKRANARITSSRK